MKLLGHAWVAINAASTGNKRLLILGSVLPEIMYYTKDHPFRFEEIHEGGDRVYQYLKNENSRLADFGLGMLAHSVKAGADKFDFDENLSILGYEGGEVVTLRKKLSDVLGVSFETAKARVHNILELAVELGIIEDNPDFVTEFNETLADQKLRKQAEGVLSECFHKSIGEVARCVDELLDKAKPDYFKNAIGLASLWAELSKEFDPLPDKQRLAELITELSDGFSGKDEVFLKECIVWTRSNIEMISRHPERK